MTVSPASTISPPGLASADSQVPSPNTPDTSCEAYRQAYGRINGVVVVGETLAHHHFRLLARAIPDDGAELLRLGQMEGNHARALSACARNLGVKADVRLAKELFAPLHRLFRQSDERGDIPGCIVIQCLIVECFAVAAYRNYLPVADAFAQPITAAVLADESEHLNYGEVWLKPRFGAVQAAVSAICLQALPTTLAILRALVEDMRAIGMDPQELVAGFGECFQQSLERIGYGSPEAARLLRRAMAA
ncbi:MAG: long-chain fatty aldehyde decarbonylase [Synechococcaceae cyanobacterium ELA739]